MEDFHGVSLKQILANGPFSLSAFLEITVRISETLGHLHKKGIEMDINGMIEKIKRHPESKKIGMIASHLGIVRGSSRDGPFGSTHSRDPRASTRTRGVRGAVPG